MNEKWRQFFWNKAIRNSLIASFLFLLISQVAIFIWSKISKIDFFQVYKKIFTFLNNSVCIGLWGLLTLIGLLILLLYLLLKRKKEFLKGQEKDNTEGEPKIKTPEILEINEAPTVFFHYRFCEAFPGTDAGITWFTNKKQIHRRLKVLLEYPTKFDKCNGYGLTIDPVFWFRGFSSSPIWRFKILNRTKVLINNDELKIEKIAAYRGHSYFKDFVYVQCFADKPTGLYEHNQLYLEKQLNEYGEYQEGFGIYKNKLIKSQDYSDGSTIIRGKPVKLKDAEFRTRTLIKYNFIIAAKFSPYNCDEFYNNSKEYFGRILKKEIEFEELASWLNKFPRNTNDD